MDYPCLDLCFASLKLGRAEEAEGWGTRALGLGNRVRPQRRRQERALPAGRDLQRAGPQPAGRGSLRGAGGLLPELPRAQGLSPPDQPDGDDQPEGMMKRRGLLGWLLASLALAALPAAGFAAEEHSLLTPDGTLHVVRAGRAVDLGVRRRGLPTSYVIDWSSAQPGRQRSRPRSCRGPIRAATSAASSSPSTSRPRRCSFSGPRRCLGVLPGPGRRAPRRKLDEFRRSFRITGISGAYNPRMLLTHQTVSHLDDGNNVVTTTSSILSVIWWEDAQYGQARYATLFLDENGFDPASLAIYDLPALTRRQAGETPYDDVPSGATSSRACRPTASRAPFSRASPISTPRSTGSCASPSRTTRASPRTRRNMDWKRRHIPIVGIASDGPLARRCRRSRREPPDEDAVGTTHRRRATGRRCAGGTADALKYTRLEGADWAPVRSIALDDVMTYEKALVARHRNGPAQLTA